MIKTKPLFLAFGLMLIPLAAASAQPVPQPAAPVSVAPPSGDVPTAAATPNQALTTTIGTSKPDPLIGQPVGGQIGLQPQVTSIGRQAAWMHDWILMPLMVAISLLVLGLLLYVMARFRRSAHPVADKTTHNTLIEVLWTLIPVFILIGIAWPSISLLAAQFKPAPANAVTLKAIGNQWFWTYELPDYGVTFDANMLSDAEAKANGEPRLLATDNRIVLPVDTPIKLITTSVDVIHAWAMPAFWIKMDSVPGRLNETAFTVEKTGVYYGQCSELCGDKHGFMPIAVEVVSKADFETWVVAKGGTISGKPLPSGEARGTAAALPADPPAANLPATAPGATPPAPAPAAAK